MNFQVAVVLGTLRGAAAGQVSFGCFVHIDALLGDDAQSLRAIHAGLCSGHNVNVSQASEVTP